MANLLGYCHKCRADSPNERVFPGDTCPIQSFMSDYVLHGVKFIDITIHAL